MHLSAVASPPRFLRRAAAAAAVVVAAAAGNAQPQLGEWPVKRYLPLDVESTSALAFADVDGDGDVDLAVAHAGPPIGGGSRLHLNDGAGRFADATAGRLPVASRPAAMVFTDVDGDGDPDLVVAQSGHPELLYSNDGTGTFTDVTATNLPGPSGITLAAAAGDVDGDGDVPVALGDVDGDGDLDLVTGNFGQRARLLLNDGTGVFTDVSVRRLPDDSDPTAAVVSGDVDGDGDLDLVLGNTGAQNRLYVNDGSGLFTDVTATRMPVDEQRTRALALGDVDGDGDLDLVLGNPVVPGLYLNDGSGTFLDRSDRMPVHGTTTHAVVLGDADDDGDLDVFLGNDGQDRLALNDGRGRFVDVTSSRMQELARATRSMALLDVDRDGDADLVVGHAGDRDRLYLNLHRQASAPFLALSGRGYRLELHSAPGYAAADHVGVLVLSSGLAPTPVPLPPLGTFFLRAPWIALPPLTVPAATGRAEVTPTVPLDPALLGSEVDAQAAIVGAPSGPRLTGYTRDVIRR